MTGEQIDNKPFGTTHSIIYEQQGRDKMFAERAKSAKESPDYKAIRECVERSTRIINDMVDKRVKAIATNLTSESIVETLDASLKACTQQAETIVEQDKVIRALWYLAGALYGTVKMPAHFKTASESISKRNLGSSYEIFEKAIPSLSKFIKAITEVNNDDN